MQSHHRSVGLHFCFSNFETSEWSHGLEKCSQGQSQKSFLGDFPFIHTILLLCGLVFKGPELFMNLKKRMGHGGLDMSWVDGKE